MQAEGYAAASRPFAGIPPHDSVSADEPIIVGRQIAEQEQQAEPIELRKFRELIRLRLLQEKSLDRIEQIANDLVKRYPDPAQVRAIRVEVAARFKAAADERVIVSAQAALRSAVSPIDRLRMYLYWSEATRTRFADNESLEGLLHSAVPPLLGLVEASRLELPDEVRPDRAQADPVQRQMIKARDNLAGQMGKLVAGNQLNPGPFIDYFRRLPRWGPSAAIV